MLFQLYTTHDIRRLPTSHLHTQVDSAAAGPTCDRLADTAPAAACSHMYPGAAGVRNVKHSFALCCEG